ncbi:MAG: hypothetical protein IJR12_00555 [Bacteroidales bacterium]|nr:hypothetical protein [Bacteroidales bacterium]
MKKTVIIAVLLAAASISAAAQSWDQAQKFSENIYGGTARTIAMGNAFTAVGGDLGSIGINPAGSAVAGYTQFVITPSLSITSTQAQGFGYDGLDPIGLGDRVSTGYTRMKMPNTGFVINMDTGRRHGLKRVSFGFVSNATNDYTYRANASGSYYGKYSYSGSLASLAQGYAPDVIGGDWYNTGYGLEPDWSAMMGARSHIFDHIGGTDYLGVTDLMVGGKPEAAGQLYQKYGYQTKGYKHDIVINMSANFNDKFYIGANMGFTTLSYMESEYWEEMPDDPSTFPQIEYDGGATLATLNSILAKRSYGVSGSGVYFKAGFLWRPFAGFRIGAAVQTPTLVNMTGRCTWYGETNLKGIYFSPSKSPEDEWVYALRMPFRWNAGIAYTFGSFAVLSVDYEMADYSSAKYRGRGDFGYSAGSWGDQNADIKDALGLGHNVRVGMEFKPSESLAIRVGYNYLSGSQRNWLVWDYSNPADPVLNLQPLTAQERAAQATQLVSFGAGYSVGHFFADFAVRLRFMPQSYFTPYRYYTSGANVYDKIVDMNAEVPEVVVSATGIEPVLTLGWRF